ncbi:MULTISPECIES: P-type DNA transfer ATPase VirB11 [Roseicella]|uniref:Type IV secretion system protein n=1 Tax=Roseicella aquatilis TaxID=2527868 RepID=A0A4R4D7R8_9PROT|nr:MULTISPECIES: P-type DNA transfer ATPase VirB11 [Roseicella]NOG73508.1 P-type DNA transfer ATPase VirB11 [Roseicella sp. DB1501]TCZ55786.1 P-type DNA transfer ATPase VirB11 [Roseicella aquatilis]
MSAAVPLLAHAMQPLAEALADPTTEDVMVQREGEFFVRRGAETTRHEAAGLQFADIEAIAILAGAARHQDVGRARPLLATELPTGERLQAVLPPCVRPGTASLTIRRGSSELPTLDGLARSGIFTATRPQPGGMSQEDHALVELYRSANWEPFLRACVRARKTVAFVGETGSGKTHQTKALVGEIPHEERIVTVEDTDEWGGLRHPNRVALFYSKGDQGAARVGANELVEAALRMAPRWLLVQELRDGAAFSFLRALASGHPGITTWHAKSAATAFDPLTLMVRQHPAGATLPSEDIRHLCRRLVDVVVHCARGQGKFYISEVWFNLLDKE